MNTMNTVKAALNEYCDVKAAFAKRAATWDDLGDAFERLNAAERSHYLGEPYHTARVFAFMRSRREKQCAKNARTAA